MWKIQKAWETQILGGAYLDEKQRPSQGHNKKRMSHKKKRENQRKYDERRLKDTMSLVNGSDPKSLELWSTLWAYKSFLS